MRLKQTFIALKRLSLQLFNYFENESKRGTLHDAINKPKKRTIHALGLDRSTLSRWIKEDRQNVCGKTEKRKRGPKPKFDSFDKDVIQRTITKMLHDTKYVTLRRLRQTLISECTYVFQNVLSGNK